jgi:hypothetical protein
VLAFDPEAISALKPNLVRSALDSCRADAIESHQ